MVSSCLATPARALTDADRTWLDTAFGSEDQIDDRYPPREAAIRLAARDLTAEIFRSHLPEAGKDLALDHVLALMVLLGVRCGR